MLSLIILNKKIQEKIRLNMHRSDYIDLERDFHVQSYTPFRLVDAPAVCIKRKYISMCK